MNRIHHIEVYAFSLSPAEAEVRLRVYPDILTPATEIRGRLVGPKNTYSSTVEVPYPLRQVSQALETRPVVLLRLVIPEPCWWEPSRPFLYTGQVELWEDSQLVDRAPVAHGLRIFQRSPKGLLLNGRRLVLQGLAERSLPTEDVLRTWHEAGVNALLLPIREMSEQTWSAADQFGFVLISQLDGVEEELASVATRASHPSCFGWLLPQSAELPPFLSRLRQASPRACIGVECAEGSPLLPEGADFVLCSESEQALQSTIPCLLRSPRPFPEKPMEAGSPQILGWIFDGPSRSISAP